MPSEASHLSTAIENRETAVTLVERPQSLAWATTIAFYSALHLVEAAFARDGKHFGSHSTRNQHLKAEPALQNIWRHYKPLYDYSLKARYLTDDDGSAEALMAKYLGVVGVRERVLHHHLRQVEKSIAKRLGVASIFSPLDRGDA